VPKVILRSVSDFFKDGGPVLAGSIAYFFLMSFVPFCLLLVSLFGYFLGENREFFEFFTARLLRFFPAATSEISNQLTALVVHRQIGIFTLVLYLYFSYQLYMALEAAIQVIFRQKGGRSLLTSVFFSFFVITMIAVLILVSFAATWAVQMLGALLEIFPSLQIGAITGFLVRFVIPVLLVLFVTTVLYILLPVKRASCAHAFRGGLFTSVFLEAARHLFTLYVVTAAPRYGAIYGPLSTLVILLLWVFYSACIFFIGAEIVRNLEEKDGYFQQLEGRSG
jgi:membrane protein